MTEAPLAVRVHPPVFLGIARHSDRARLTGAAALGVLFGRAGAVVAALEAVGAAGGAVDWPAVRHRREMIAAVAPELRVVGWYGTGATGEAAADCARVMHAALCETFGEEIENGVALGMMVDTEPPEALASIPSRLFRATLLRDCPTQEKGEKRKDEEEVGGQAIQEGVEDDETPGPVHGVFLNENASGSRHVVTNVDGQTGMHVRLEKLCFVLESDDIEQAGLDAAMNSVAADKPFASVAPQRHRIQQSLRMLRQRITLATAYLEEVESGRITQLDQKALQHISKACAMLPSSTTYDDVHDESTGEVTQSLMAALLAQQTKCALTLNELVCEQSKPQCDKKKETISVQSV